MRIYTFSSLVKLLIIASISYSQNPNETLFIGKSRVFTEGILKDYKIGENASQNSNLYTQERSYILRQKRKYFKGENIIHSVKDHPVFELPVRLADPNSDPGFFSITAYFDHDSLFPGHLLDYQCDSLTYDLEIGYNHSGTDFFIWPFPWYKMYNDGVEVIAAASGVLYYKQDGNNDQQCELNNEPSNSVAILHEDGTTAWYVHLKKNSITNKNPGEEIEAGEYLGIVGSSGSSIAPHLHFEVFDSEGNLIDPFYGPCNEDIDETWWLEQISYKDPGINRITTNNHLPFFPECPSQEITNETDIFYPGDSIYLLSYLRNVSLDDEIVVTISRPDNSVFASWIWNSPWEFYSASWLYFLMFIENDQFGVWKYSIQFKDVQYENNFQLLNPQGIDADEYSNNLQVYPIPCKDYFTLDLKNQSPCQIEIFNNVGAQVYSESIRNDRHDSHTFNIAHLNPGIYIVRISTYGGYAYSKIIKY